MRNTVTINVLQGEKAPRININGGLLLGCRTFRTPIYLKIRAHKLNFHISIKQLLSNFEGSNRVVVLSN